MATRNGLRLVVACVRGQFSVQPCRKFTSESQPVPLRSVKDKSKKPISDYFADAYTVQTFGGKGGDGCISFLRLFVNDRAGPDGGHGGNGGHVIFKATSGKTDLSHLSRLVRAEDGERGNNCDCIGKNGKHAYVEVPIGTVIKNKSGVIVGDLSRENAMFLAARGGAGGRGNSFFVSATNQSPRVAEVGAMGEIHTYHLELKAMAHFGLVGLPNAGKSTLLRAVSRARPEVAGYEFTTLRPYIGVVTYSDYEQVHIADLPGLISGSHRNEGLGIQFLKHTERCLGLLYVIDMSRDNPLSQLDTLKHELSEFSEVLLSRPSVLVANKMDLEVAQSNLREIEENTDMKFIPISAKTGKNLSNLLKHLRTIYDEFMEKQSLQDNSNASSTDEKT